VRVPAEWEYLADVLLQRAALLARVDRNRAPDPLAGLKVDDDDVAALLAELPGLEPAIDERVADLDEVLADSVEDAVGAFAGMLALDGPFARLVASAGLSATEAMVLAVLCAVEVDPRRQRLVGYLNDDVTQRRLTAWTLAQVAGPAGDARLAVAPGGGLRRAALLAPAGDQPWAAAPVAVASSVLWWLAGDRSFDPDLPAGSEVVAGPDGADGPGAVAGDPEVVVVAGADRVRRLQAAVGAVGGTCLVVAVPRTPAQWDAVIRQATLGGWGAVVELEEGLDRESRDRIERASHLHFAVTSPVDLALATLPRRAWVGVEAEPAAATEEEWAASFPAVASASYRLSAEQLLHVGRASRALGDDLPSAVRRLAAGHIDATATRIRPERGWDDLVLDDERMTQVRTIATRWHHRRTVFGEWGFAPQPSTGVVALFAGPSGTGKTLAAEVIATDLGVDLYKVDLAHMVSKYIGETEKNLSAVFDAAEASSVVLFFDEADALLGKRSEVSDAHDRYANIEVAYLLQRLERFEGVAVMATNLLKNIDPAFLRRLHLVVEFAMPEAAERRRIWRHALPPGAPLADDLELDRLADTFELSGGTIRNAVMSAAFLAAEAGTPIGRAHVVTALRSELRKMGRLVADADFP
jgi:AAA+ superfamily predicted ATPase